MRKSSALLGLVEVVSPSAGDPDANDWDDEQLLGALREAMRARQAVPSWFVAMGKNAYAWHNIDAELAQLTYDSHADTEQLAS